MGHAQRNFLKHIKLSEFTLHFLKQIYSACVTRSAQRGERVIHTLSDKQQIRLLVSGSVCTITEQSLGNDVTSMQGQEIYLIKTFRSLPFQ
jgi:hypothetical protein